MTRIEQQAVDPGPAAKLSRLLAVLVVCEDVSRCGKSHSFRGKEPAPGFADRDEVVAPLGWNARVGQVDARAAIFSASSFVPE